MGHEVGLMLVLLKDAKLACKLAFTVVYARDFTVQGLLFSEIVVSLCHDAFISRLTNTHTHTEIRITIRISNVDTSFSKNGVAARVADR
jgi:hypothetical protein